MAIPSSGEITLDDIRFDAYEKGWISSTTTNFSLTTAITSGYGDIFLDVGDTSPPHAMSEFYGATFLSV